MPADVATRLLCNPLNKMTAKQRKRAWSARETAAPSRQPIVKKGNAYVYGEDRSIPREEKLAGSLKGRSYGQLILWEKRTLARIRVMERLADKLENIKQGVTAGHIRARIAQMHAVGGLLQQEIDTRG